MLVLLTEGDSRLSALASEVPLVSHARYTRGDVLAALAVGTGPKPPPSREGLTSTSDERYDAFFVDLQKAERDYSPTTMYRDYAINRELFHWESQSTQTPHQPRVRRWIEHQQRGGEILLFVRDKRRSELGTQPFTFLGPVTYVDHRGSDRSRSRGACRFRCPRSYSRLLGAWRGPRPVTGDEPSG